MIVSELIEKLQEMPPTHDVRFLLVDNWYFVEDVEEDIGSVVYISAAMN